MSVGQVTYLNMAQVVAYGNFYSQSDLVQIQASSKPLPFGTIHLSISNVL